MRLNIKLELPFGQPDNRLISIPLRQTNNSVEELLDKDYFLYKLSKKFSTFAEYNTANQEIKLLTKTYESTLKVQDMFNLDDKEIYKLSNIISINIDKISMLVNYRFVIKNTKPFLMQGGLNTSHLLDEILYIHNDATIHIENSDSWINIFSNSQDLILEELFSPEVYDLANKRYWPPNPTKGKTIMDEYKMDFQEKYSATVRNYLSKIRKI